VCRVGLNGILASVYCKRVVMTDYHDKVVDLLQRNIQLNSHRTATPFFFLSAHHPSACVHSPLRARRAVGTDMQAAKLTWGEGVVEFNQQYGPFDIIIGSGCVYASTAPPPLSSSSSHGVWRVACGVWRVSCARLTASSSRGCLAGMRASAFRCCWRRRTICCR